MFQGFDNTTIEFMWGLRFHNEKAWFEANRQTFVEHLQTPMRELLDEVYRHIAAKLPRYPLTAKVSRIYRDARRLHGGGPYRDHLWLSVEQPHESGTFAAIPCFWFELDPDKWSYGMGYYSAKPLTMAKLRARIIRNPKPLERMTRQLDRQKEFVLEGETYKKPKSGAPSKTLERWFRLKNMALCHEEALCDRLYSRELLDELLSGYDFLLPWYQYFVTLDGEPVPDKL